MARNKIVFGVGAGVVSLGIDGVSGLVLLKLLKQYLTPEAAGYWVLVTTSGSFLLLLQCGLGPSVTRAVAKAVGTGGEITLLPLLGTIRRSLHLVIGLVAVASVILFAIYLLPSQRQGGLESTAIAAWFLYAAGIALNLNGQGYLFVMNGIGQVGWDKILRSVTVLGSLGSIWWALHTGRGLLSLGMIQFAGGFFFSLSARILLARAIPGRPLGGPVDLVKLKELFKIGSKLLVLNVGGFLITNFGIIVAERRFGLASLIPLTAMLKVGTLLSTIGSLIPTMSFPYVAAAHARGDAVACRRYYVVGVVASVATYLILAVPVFLLAKPLFELWLGPGNYAGTATFGAVLVFNAVQVHHSAHSLPYLAVVGSAFLALAIVNCLLVVAFTLLLPESLGLKLVPIAMIAGTCIPSAIVVAESWKSFSLSRTVART